MTKTKNRAKKPKTDFQKNIKKVRESLSTSIIEVEIKSTPLGYKKVLQCKEHARLIRNTDLGKIEDRLDQLLRAKKYKQLLKNYAEVCKKLENTKVDKRIKQFTKVKNEISKEMKIMQQQYNVTFDYVRKYSEKLRLRFSKADAVIALKMAERAWKSIEDRLYNSSKKSNYIGEDYFYSIEGKQNERCIMLKRDEKKKDNFFISFTGERFDLIVKKNDLFIQETLAAIGNYFDNGLNIDLKNIENMKLGLSLESTYRVKYNRIIFKEIRGKIRLFVQIVLEGTPHPKRKKDGTFRHKLGTGRIGNDIGNQSVAIITENHVELKNLAERTTKSRERKIIKLQNALDRSRRANNLDCFDEKGRAIKKMHTKSKRYVEKQKQLRNLHRIMAENRKYAHHEDINKQRALGDELFTESANYKSLQVRAKETTINEKTGNFNRKKRAGKSILNRSPGYYHSWAKYRFGVTGGVVHDVDTFTFKASQYDHKTNDTNKKTLSQRWHYFKDGDIVQRDIYSGFLAFCSDDKLKNPDKDLCEEKYKHFKKLHDECVSKIKHSGKEVKNSGIKVLKSKNKPKVSFKEKKRNKWFASLKQKKKELIVV